MEKKRKLNYLNTMLLGTGFMAISLYWALFNSYVPIFLKKYIASTALVGWIMTIDNIAGMTLQPLISSMSDRTWSKNGRRMPYLMTGIPLAAIFFILLPMHFNLLTLLVSIVMVDVSMSIFRGPTVALMPDLTAPSLRSKANGIINFMGGLGALIAFFVGSQLYDISPYLPFAMASVIMVGVLFLLKLKIKEPHPDQLSSEIVNSEEDKSQIEGVSDEPEQEKKSGIFKALFQVFLDKDKSCLFLLLAIFCWFIGWNGIEAFFTTYGKEILGKESIASRLLGYFSLSFLIFAIPSGYIATKIGRKRTILAGLIGFALSLLFLFIFKTPTMIAVFLLIGGICWALININSYPMVVQMAKNGNIGAYTGLYYFFASIAAVAAPPIFGSLMDKLGNSIIFILGSLSMVIALLLMTRVKSGEANLDFVENTIAG